MVNFKTATGSNVFYTETKVNQINALLQDNIPEIQSATGSVNKNFGDGSNNATLVLDVGSKMSRARSLDEIMKQTRQIIQQVGGIKLENIRPTGGAGGDNKPINIDIKGDNVQILKQISDDVMAKVEQVPGTQDVSSSFQDVDPAFSIDINREVAATMGINLADVGTTISSLFAGNKVSTWEDPKNGQNYDVMVQIPERDRNKSVLNLLQVPTNVMNADGTPKMVSLSTITNVSNGESPREIDHIDLQRKVTITGNISSTDKQKVYAEIQTVLDNYKLPHGYQFNQSGDNEDMIQSFLYAVTSLAIGIAFIYMILTAQFRSFLQPLIIMVALPLSFVGVFIALITFGSTLNMFSIIGIIMLMGLATKNGILLVDFINQQIRDGVEVIDAIVNAGKTRLRPIIMTSLAMIFGMLPLAIAAGEGTETRKPMAYAIIGGMTTSTILTLIVVPVLYYVMVGKSQAKKAAKQLNAHE